jgi:hypothetical protein
MKDLLPFISTISNFYATVKSTDCHHIGVWIAADTLDSSWFPVANAESMDIVVLLARGHPRILGSWRFWWLQTERTGGPVAPVTFYIKYKLSIKKTRVSHDCVARCTRAIRIGYL